MLAVLAVLVAMVFGCEPLNDGKPDCNVDPPGNYRKLSNASKYWVCSGPGEPDLVDCPANTYYLKTEDQCVPAYEWYFILPNICECIPLLC